MKLSEKGLKKIQRWQDAKRLGHAYPADEIEFEHDDFEGFITLSVNIPRGVFLTVEEAKEFRLLCSWVMETGLNRKNLKSLEEHHDLLVERIKLVEVEK